jgi:hypothetical protein
MKGSQPRGGAIDFFYSWVSRLKCVVKQGRHGEALNHSRFVQSLAKVKAVIERVFTHGYTFDVP